MRPNGASPADRAPTGAGAGATRSAIRSCPARCPGCPAWREGRTGLARRPGSGRREERGWIAGERRQRSQRHAHAAHCRRRRLRAAGGARTAAPRPGSFPQRRQAARLQCLRTRGRDAEPLRDGLLGQGGRGEPGAKSEVAPFERREGAEAAAEAPHLGTHAPALRARANGFGVLRPPPAPLEPWAAPAGLWDCCPAD